jgi:hypothetical protein
MTRRLLVLLPLAACLRADSEKDARDLVASLADALSAGKVELFLDSFDRGMPDFDKLRFNVAGLMGQSDVSCNVEIASNEGDDRAEARQSGRDRAGEDGEVPAQKGGQEVEDRVVRTGRFVCAGWGVIIACRLRGPGRTSRWSVRWAF